MNIQQKKGDIFQLLFLLVILFISAIIGILFLTLSNKVTQEYANTGLLNDTAIGTYANEIMQQSAPQTIDYMVFFLFLGSVIGIVISSVRTNFSPTTIFLFILLLLITIFVASGLVNIYSGFAQAEGLSEAAEQLTLTGFVFSRYTPLVFAVIGGLIMLIMWGKSGGDIIT